MGSMDSMVVMESERASSRGQDPKYTEESGRFGKKISFGVARIVSQKGDIGMERSGKLPKYSDWIWSSDFIKSQSQIQRVFWRGELDNWVCYKERCAYNFFSITLTIGKSGVMKSGEAERFREQSWVSCSWFLYVFISSLSVLIGFSFEFLLFFYILFLMLWLRVETLYKFKLWIKIGSLCCCYCCLSDTIIISIVL